MRLKTTFSVLAGAALLPLGASAASISAFAWCNTEYGGVNVLGPYTSKCDTVYTPRDGLTGDVVFQEGETLTYNASSSGLDGAGLASYRLKAYHGYFGMRILTSTTATAKRDAAGNPIVGLGRATASVELRAADNIYLRSDVLPDGTPLTLTFGMYVEGGPETYSSNPLRGSFMTSLEVINSLVIRHVTGETTIFGQQWCYGMAGDNQACTREFTTANSLTRKYETFTMKAYVGDLIQMDSMMFGWATSASEGSDAVPSVQAGAGIYSYDSMHSGFKLPDGVHLVADSGTAYVMPVPEPATWALMAAGVASIGLAARRGSTAGRPSA